MKKLVVMRVYERDAKRLRAKYPNYKSDAARLDGLLFDHMNASLSGYYGGDPKDKLLINDSMDKSGRVGTTMPKAVLEMRGEVKK